jgi:hypothetical protein
MTSRETRSFQKSMTGNWQLQTIVSEGVTGKVKTQLFNEASFDCFVGSNWNFTKNNMGNYTIPNATECQAIKRNISWSIYEAKDQPKLLQYKRLDDNLREIDANSGGFHFTILQLNNTNMKLKADMNIEGKPAALVYNFVKI